MTLNEFITEINKVIKDSLEHCTRSAYFSPTDNFNEDEYLQGNIHIESDYGTFHKIPVYGLDDDILIYTGTGADFPFCAEFLYYYLWHTTDSRLGKAQ